jgi:hypothetical protein
MRALGMFSYYRRQLPNLAKIAAPLYALCREETPFVWEEVHRNAFKTLLEIISNPPILNHYNPQAETFLEVDASKIAFGAVLSQLDEHGVKRPISFASRGVTAAEAKLASAALECTGLAWAILHFKYFLYGIPFTVLSDSHAICAITRLKDPYGRIARLLLRLQPYNFKMCHISGKKHVCPDFLSRHEADWDPFDEEEFNAELEIPSCFTELVNIQKAQEADVKIKNIIDAIKSGCISNAERQYVLQDNILYKKGISERGNLHLLVIPETLKSQIMEIFHDDPIQGAHLSFSKCFDKIKLRFYWQNMIAEIKRYIKSCPICQAFNKTTQKKQGCLQPVERPRIPFLKLGIDFAGPFPRSKRGNTMLIVAIDYHSNWVELKAIRAATAEKTAEFLLRHFICRHGAFSELVCDRGSQFTSVLMAEFIKLFNGKVVRISTYHPASNGRTERMVKTVKSIIAKYCDPRQRNWDELIDQIQFAINTSPHKSLQESPYAMVYQRQPIFLGELAIDQDYTNPFVEEIRDRLALAETLIAKNYKKQQEEDKERFDSKRRLISYQPGQWVSVYVPKTKIGLSKKLLPFFFGPYEIVEKISDITYRVRIGHGTRARVEPIHVERLKPFFKREDD